MTNLCASEGSTPDTRYGRGRRRYLTVLNAAFAVISSMRLVSYLPNLWAIHASGNSNQHSLWTWLTWLFSNVVMAAWLYEEGGRRVNKAVVVIAGNAVMCLATCGLIVWYRR